METNENQTQRTWTCSKCRTVNSGELGDCAYCDPSESPERAVKIIAGVIQTAGIILGLILIIAGLATDVGEYNYRPEWASVIYGLAAILSSLFVWGVLMMLVNISISLKNKKP